MIPKNENDLIVVDLDRSAGENGPDSGNRCCQNP